MRQKLVLHIGSHKTGSTSIQNYLYWNRLWLKPMGIYYPAPLTGGLFLSNNHRELRDAARSERQRSGAHINKSTGSFASLLDRYTRRITRAGAPLTILSCEGWSAQMNLFADALAPLADHFDVQVVAYIRRPDYFIESLYRQRVVNTEHREVREFSEFASLPTMQRAIYDRANILGWWAGVFGSERVTALPFEPAVSGFDLIGRFLTAAGAPKGLARHLPLRRSHANRTAGAAEVELIRLCHKYGVPPNLREIRRRIGRRRHATRGYLTAAERTLLLGRAAADMQEITDIYVRDGRMSLFPTDPETPRDHDLWDRGRQRNAMSDFEDLVRESG